MGTCLESLPAIERSRVMRASLSWRGLLRGIVLSGHKTGSQPRPFHRRICILARPPGGCPAVASKGHIKCQKPKAPRFWYAIFGHPGPGRIFAGHPRRNAATAQNTPPPRALTKHPPLSSYSPRSLRQRSQEGSSCLKASFLAFSSSKALSIAGQIGKVGVSDTPTFDTVCRPPGTELTSSASYLRVMGPNLGKHLYPLGVLWHCSLVPDFSTAKICPNCRAHPLGPRPCRRLSIT
jgi:hypothetical protein